MNESAPWIEDRWPRDPARVRSIVLVLHGGQARSPTTVRRWPQLSYLRMVPVARLLHRHEGGRGMSVRILRYRYRGWDEPQRHPVQDARWALTQLDDQHPDASIVLLGHSMGARAALRVADHPAVTAVCALAPWTMNRCASSLGARCSSRMATASTRPTRSYPTGLRCAPSRSLPGCAVSTCSVMATRCSAARTTGQSWPPDS